MAALQVKSSCLKFVTRRGRQLYSGKSDNTDEGRMGQGKLAE
jgi:hypothetical protein